MNAAKGIKIVLLNIESNTERVKRQFSPPFGILIAASVLRKHNIEVTVRHLIDDEDIEQTLSAICQGAFVVGFSTMTSSNLLPTIRATKYVKSLGYYTFWGGIHATLLPELSLREPDLDAVLRGEAESNLYEFVQWRLGKIDHHQVRGLCFRRSTGEIIIDEIPTLVSEIDLSSHSFELLDLIPYLEKNKSLVNQKNYIDKRMLPYMTSKGCNKKCTFCYNSVVNKCRWRGYNLNTVFSEMDWLIENHSVEGWLFYDDNFFVDQNRAWQILERYKMPSLIEIDLAKVSHSLLDKSKKLNVEKLFIGIESGSDFVLRRIKKGINQKMIREKIAMCNSVNMKIELSFMILFPNEKPEELEMTLNLIDELSNYENITISGPKIYNPYPGTNLYCELIESGWQAPTNNYEWAKFERNISPSETGFTLTDKHLLILESRGLI